MDRSTPGLPVHHQLWEFTQTHVHLVSDAIQPSHPLSSPSPPAFNLSFPASGSFQMSQFFAVGSQSFSFSISPSDEYSGLVSFRIDWFDLLAVQGTLNCLFQWVSSSHQVAQVLELQQYSVTIQGWFPLGLTGLISLQFKELSRVFSSTTDPRHQFFSAQPFLLSGSHS